MAEKNELEYKRLNEKLTIERDQANQERDRAISENLINMFFVQITRSAKKISMTQMRNRISRANFSAWKLKEISSVAKEPSLTVRTKRSSSNATSTFQHSSRGVITNFRINLPPTQRTYLEY
jgi:hypothetical protein